MLRRFYLKIGSSGSTLHNISLQHRRTGGTWGLNFLKIRLILFISVCFFFFILELKTWSLFFNYYFMFCFGLKRSYWNGAHITVFLHSAVGERIKVLINFHFGFFESPGTRHVNQPSAVIIRGDRFLIHNSYLFILLMLSARNI
jgi:hypothetical protein